MLLRNAAGETMLISDEGVSSYKSNLENKIMKYIELQNSRGLSADEENELRELMYIANQITDNQKDSYKDSLELEILKLQKKRTFTPEELVKLQNYMDEYNNLFAASQESLETGKQK